MPRRAVLKVVKTNYTPNTPWMVRVPPRLHRSKVRGKGSSRKSRSRKRTSSGSRNSLATTTARRSGSRTGKNSKRQNAIDCLRDTTRACLMRCTITSRTSTQTKRSIPVGELFEEFLSIKQQDNVSPKYLADLRSKLGRFVNSFHDTLVCNLTVAQVEAWIRSLDIGTVSRESYRRNVSVLLEFGRRRGYLRANPAADIKIRRRPEGEVSILTPDELRNLLSKCAPEIVPYVTICAFAGLRPSEAASLLWSDIHLDTMQIEVRARHSKTRRYRLVPIQPNLGEWLMRFRSEDGSIYYSRRKFREAYKAAGMMNGKWTSCVIRMARIVCQF